MLFNRPTLSPFARNMGMGAMVPRAGFNWSSLFSNAQKALNVANQAIPLVRQVGPVVNNAKTMFKVVSEFRKVDNKKGPNNSSNNQYQTNNNVHKSPNQYQTDINKSTDHTNNEVDNQSDIGSRHSPQFFI